jgi:predicted dehydrogenase
MADKVKVGVVGCGNISGIYLQNMRDVFEILEVAACADIIHERAEEKASLHPGVKALSVDDLFADGEIEIVVNLTTPDAHAEVAQRAVEAGKSVYNEKPLTIKRAEADLLLETADKNGVLVGGAPDTFLGAGYQTCRKLIEDGWIGAPVAATAFMTCHGHESWHPAPEFYYQVGGGPMFDMGPYYVTALVSLLGAARRVTGSARITFAERTITSEPLYGKVVNVEVPTHIAGVVDFESGAVATVITSFDVWAANLPCIEIYGSEGSLSCPDPNTFGGPVRVMRAGGEWAEVPLSHGYAENSRGLGVADMASALRSRRPQRASGELCRHVLDIMHAFHDASDSGKHAELETTAARPSPLPLGLRKGIVD